MAAHPSFSEISDRSSAAQPAAATITAAAISAFNPPLMGPPSIISSPRFMLTAVMRQQSTAQRSNASVEIAGQATRLIQVDITRLADRSGQALCSSNAKTRYPRWLLRPPTRTARLLPALRSVVGD